MAKQWDLAVPVEVLFPEILENGDVVFSSARVSTAEEGHPVGNEVENAHAVPAHVQSIHQRGGFFSFFGVRHEAR